MKIKVRKINYFFIIAILLLALSIIIVKPFSKSEIIVNTNLRIAEDNNRQMSINVEGIELEDESIGIQLPEEIENRKVESYILNIVKDGMEEQYTIMPEEIFVLSNEQKEERQIDLDVIFKQVLEEQIMLMELDAVEEDIIPIEEDQIVFSGGNGTQGSPYKIANERDLEELANLVNANDTLYNNKYYILTDDIDLSSYNGNWVPIGKDKSVSFLGNFNGNGHVVKNLNIYLDSIPTNASDLAVGFGLFGNLKGNGTVKNLHVDSANIRVHVTDSSKISTSGSNAIVRIGIIAGGMDEAASIINCIVTNSNISTTAYIFPSSGTPPMTIGGIVGDIGDYNTVSRSMKVENCFAEVDININETGWPNNGTSNKYYQYGIGGIAGRLRKAPYYPKNCVYTGEIISNHAFIGPIYANARNNEGSTFSEYDNLFIGQTTTGAFSNNYFYNYAVNGQTFESDYKTRYARTISSKTVYTLSQTQVMGKFQGVNKGEYIETLEEKLDMFNFYAGSNYSKWFYSSKEDSFAFCDPNEVDLEIIDKGNYNYAVRVNSTKEVTLSYRWYLNEVEQQENGEEIQIDKPIEDTQLTVEGYKDGELVATKTIEIEEYNFNINLIKEENDGEYAYVINSDEISSESQIWNNYEIFWYEINGANFNLLDNKDITLTSNELKDGYKVVLEHKTKPEYNKSIMFYNNNHKHVFVNFSEQTINNITYPAGNNANDGLTPQTAVKTLAQAYSLLSDDLTRDEQFIIIMGQYKNRDNSWSEMATTQEAINDIYIKPATLTGKFYGIDYNGNLGLYGSGSTGQNIRGTFLYADTTFENLILSPSTGNTDVFIYCQTRNLTMGEGLVMKDLGLTYTGSTANGMLDGKTPNFHVIAGWLSYNNSVQIKNDVVHIDIKSGSYARILCGNRQGVIAASENVCHTSSKPLNVEVNIDIEDYDSAYEYSINSIFGGQTEGSVYENLKLNIKNGKIGRICGGNIGNDVEDNGKPGNTFFGSTQVNIQGGSVEELYGGSLGRISGKSYQYGKIELNISGGEIQNNIYGAGAGALTGYHENSTDTYKQYAENVSMMDIDGNIYRLDETTVRINVTGGTVNGSVYGAGYGFSDMLTSSQVANNAGSLYGDTFINISGGTINGSVFGGGKGTDGYGKLKANLAQMIGDISINVTGNPNITGSIYGAGEGFEQFPNMAEVIGNININIDSENFNLNGDVYGGGAVSKTLGDITLYINANSINNIFGGGNAGEVQGDIKLDILNGTIRENVYGGGNSETVDSIILNIGNPNSIGSNVMAQNIYGGNNETAKTVDKSISTIEINLYNDINSNIYGGCNNTGLVLSRVDITLNENAKVNGNIFGAGYGSESLVGLEESESQINIILNENSKIQNGNIYGGGSNGKVFGNCNIESKGSVETLLDTKTDIKGYIFGGGYGTDATITGNTNIFLEGANAQGIYGGGYSGTVIGDSNIAIKNSTLEEVFGAGYGQDAQINNTKINIADSEIKANIYGGGNDGQVLGNTDIFLSKSCVGQEEEDNGLVFGGGKGTTATVNGTTKTHIQNCIIYGSVFGGGNAGNVLDNTDVLVYDASNITVAVYGGGNQANIGTQTKWADTSVKVYNADIGKIVQHAIYGGEVFGGGNYGIVYGNTVAEVGTIEEAQKTNIGNHFYAGGRGSAGAITVYGNSNGIITGMNTEVNAYGDISLGAVQGDVNITFIDYRKQSSRDKYKNMSGINKATNLRLQNAFVYLTGGITDITNLFVPENSGIMISADSEIFGDFTGGGELYLQNEVCLTIDGDLTEESEITKLTINPKLFEEERYYVIQGNKELPYVVVKGVDNSNGTGIISGNSRKYIIYSDKLENENTIYYIDANLIISSYAHIINKNSEDKIYFSNITNEDDAYILQDSSFTSEIDILYTMVKQKNDNDEYEFSNPQDFLNVKRLLRVEKNGRTVCLPEGTVITMIINNELYYYRIGSDMRENISLNSFKNENNDYYLEVNNIQNLLELNDPNIPAIWEKSEIFRFIVDFSNCDTYLDSGNYSIILGLYDVFDENAGIQEEDEVYTNIQERAIQIENRNYKFEIKNFTEVPTYRQDDIIQIDGKFSLNNLSLYNETDLDKNVEMELVILDNNGKIVKIPKGAVANIVIDGVENELMLFNENKIRATIINSLTPSQYEKDISLTIDMTGIQYNYLSEGQYTIKLDFYLSNEENVFLENKPKISKSYEIRINDIKGYGIEIIMNKNDDQVQIISEEQDISKTINLKYKRGNLEDGEYIIVETYKRNTDNSLEYTKIDSLAVQQKIYGTDLSENISSSIIFDKNLDNGTYKIVYKLFDNKDILLTTTGINYIVER